ncbi:MAG TPA: hypothetical protein VNJ46_01105 [Gaiellaceae bacterium]|nr:hypothetical protein [Gaiellaceae bacterium]
MATYLLETYVPRGRAAGLARAAEAARRAALLACSEGRHVQLVRSTFLPTDEVALLVFEAVSADVVGEIARRAGLRYERIVEAVERPMP